MVRSCWSNLISGNTVRSNGVGASLRQHFFGIEVANDLTPDYEGARGLDFAPCDGNVVANNSISGPHYSGVFVGEECRDNFLFRNVIRGSSLFSIENHGNESNIERANECDAPCLERELSSH